MKKIVLSFIILVFLFGCSKKVDEIKISEDKVIKKLESVENIHDDLYEFEGKVQLENPGVTEDGKPILATWFSDIKVSDEFIFGNTKTDNVYVWNRQGEFIGKVGNKGKGPGEYFRCWGIFFYDNDEICIFDGDRKYILKYKIDEKNKKIDFVKQYDGGNISLHNFRAYGRRKDNFYFFRESGINDIKKGIITDTNFNVVKKFHNREHQSINSYRQTALSENKIVMRDDLKNSKNTGKSELFSNKIWIYDLKGNFLRKFDTETAKFVEVVIGNYNSYIYLFESDRDKTNIYVYNINGKFIKKIRVTNYISKHYDRNDGKTINLIKNGVGNRYFIEEQNPDELDKSSILYIYKFNPGFKIKGQKNNE